MLLLGHVLRIVQQINIDYHNTEQNVSVNVHPILIYMEILQVNIVFLNVIMQVEVPIPMLILLIEYVKHHVYLCFSMIIDVSSIALLVIMQML